METKTKTTLYGNVRETTYNGIVVDECVDESEHWQAPVKYGEVRRTCKKYVNDLFQEYVGRKGVMTVTIKFEEE